MSQTPNVVRTHTVHLMKDFAIDVPQLWADVYVEGDSSEQIAFANYLSRASCHKANAPDVADIVIFTGGSDVNPELYGKKRHHMTFCNERRDEREMELYLYCVEHGIPMLGICRGAQFLHVMNGGTLFQDVDGHNSKHTIFDIKNRKHIGPASSVHHQMVRPNEGMDIIADALQSTVRWIDNEEKQEGRQADIEAFFYRDTVCLGIQGHPEYRGFAQYSIWCLEQINEYLVTNPDLELQGKYRRVKKDLLEERKLVKTCNSQQAGVEVN